MLWLTYITQHHTATWRDTHAETYKHTHALTVEEDAVVDIALNGGHTFCSVEQSYIGWPQKYPLKFKETS